MEYHQFFGEVLDLYLTPYDIEVQVDVPVMAGVPRADILLLNGKGIWTKEQKSILPDGLRHSKATKHLFEFKYTEHFDFDNIIQILGYHLDYRNYRKVSKKDCQPYLILARTPRCIRDILGVGFHETEYSGVYMFNKICPNLTLILLSELENTPWNAAFRIFSTRRRTKAEAFSEMLLKYERKSSSGLKNLILFLYKLWIDRTYTAKEGDQMIQGFTSAQVKKFVSLLSDEAAHKWFEDVPVKQKLAGVTLEERLAGLKLEDRLFGLKPKDVLSQYAPKDVLSQYTVEELDEYLQKRKEKKL